MADFQQRHQASVQGRTGVREGIDEGLRTFMLGVYNNMAIGLVVTGLAALAMAYLAVAPAGTGVVGFNATKDLTAVGSAIYTSPLRWVIMFAPLAFVFMFSASVDRMQPATARMVFFAFAAVMGVSMSWIFLVFTGDSIVQTFFVTSAAFGSLSLWGYTTKRDISGWGSFLFMGLIGVILASVVNLFMQSSAMHFAISVIGVLVFAGLTAYDTQRIKNSYDIVAHDAVAAGRASVIGALHLYLDFINLFMFLLQFLGNRE